MKTIHLQKLSALMALLATATFLNACGLGDEVDKDKDKKNASGFKLYLTDAPNQQLTSVFVNIKNFEVWLEGNGKEARLILGENTGLVDLLQLQNGALMPIASLNLPESIHISKFRIILEDGGHYAVKKDGSLCDLRTPSEQKSGLKINLRDSIAVSPGSNLSVVLDFDAQKSVVQLGNGDCLLKPVLKLKTAIAHEPEDGLNYAIGDIPAGDDIMGDEQPTNEGDPTADDGNGFDPSDPSTWPEGITEEDLIHYF